MEKLAQKKEGINKLLKEQKYDLALISCAETIGEFPEEAELYYLKALTLWNKSDVFNVPRDEFSNLLKKATDLDPHYSEPHKLWAYANQLLGYPSMADTGYTRAIEANPEDWEAYGLRGELRLICGMHQEALEDLNKIIDAGQGGNRAYAFRADAKYALKDYKGALADYTKGIELNPNYGGGYYGRGRCKYALEDYAGAVEEYSKAISLFPKEASLYVPRGDAKIRLQDFTGAWAD
ncbi:MAG: tetratricopeptide repeat protein, partial [Elusimicrobiaceae bacterium]|nr:tetratricopeptide repeat protein [Elusimicrobiaceae bacterium]